MNMLHLARVAVLIALALNVKRGLAIPMPPASSHEWLALSTCLVLGTLEAAAFIALGSRARGPTIFVYSLGGLGLAAVVTHLPMLVHLVRDREPVGFFAMALAEGTALGLAALFKWRHERSSPRYRGRDPH